MKARVGVASAAIAVLTVSGIKSALPGVPMGPDPSEGRATQVRVAAVVDGDTLRVEDLSGRDLGRVRLLGIDAPEVAHPPAPAQCYAHQAADLLDELAPVGSTVRLLTDSGQADTDRYDRLLRYVDQPASTWPTSFWPAAPHATRLPMASPAKSRTPQPPREPRTPTAACGAPVKGRPRMDEQLMTDAKKLARWCYTRGVDERVLGCNEQLLRAAVDQALGRPTPTHLEHALWQQTGTLLRQRRNWDRDHQVSPPPLALCLTCAVAVEKCPTHADRRCRACGGQLHRLIIDEGYDTHPCCDPPGTPGSHAALEHTAQMLGATLIVESHLSTEQASSTQFARGDRPGPRSAHR
jgi:hypothetical protein